MRVLFVSFHCLVDRTNGAAIASLDLLSLLRRRDWYCEVLCGPVMDRPPSQSLRDYLLEVQGRAEHVGYGVKDGRDFERIVIDGVPIEVFCPTDESNSVVVPKSSKRRFVSRLEEKLATMKPDVVIGFGGDESTQTAFARCRAAGLPVVFSLHNFAYTDQHAFSSCTDVLVPSRFCADHYWRTLGLRCHAIPSPIVEDRVRCASLDDRYVTFVNPSTHKGVYLFAAIARKLQEVRPDIRLLVVEGRAGVDWLLHACPELRRSPSVYRMRNTNDPREFYQVSHIILVPSVWQESFGRVAAEALMNGIPVICSDRGALPEVVGDAGVQLTIPRDITPESRRLPSDSEIAEWVRHIILLWDDEAEWRRLSEAGVARSALWSESNVGEHHARWLSSLPGKLSVSLRAR